MCYTLYMSRYSIRNTEGDTLLDRLLHSRGIVNPEEKQAFLNPEYATGVHDPYLLKDMERVVKRIKDAVSKNEKICIYSDFDADGIPGAVVLHDFFKKIEFNNFENYIPHRHREGFGIHIAALDEIALGGSTLVISIDCGIADVEAATRAKELGIDLIITDHHTPGEVLPEAYAIINPKQPGCEYPEKMLCGSGVIYKVVQALVKEFNLKEGTEKWWLDMVGIATLSDMVPLVGENRIFAHFGLVVLRKTRRIGLQKLFSALKINPAHLVEEDITFMVTPRINAASRMADPKDAFILLSTTDEAEADLMVKHLEQINGERKTQVAQLVKQIHALVVERNLNEKPVIVLGNPNWKPPVLGLVATNLVREYGKPVFLWGRSEEDVVKGSCRSPEGIDIVSVMRKISNPEKVYINMGGHSASGGFSLTEEGVHIFEEQLIDSFNTIYNEQDSEGQGESILVDAYLESHEVSSGVWSAVSKLSPFGEGNPKPVFVLKSVSIEGVKMFGKQKEHIEIQIKTEGGKIAKAIKFFAADDTVLISKIEGKNKVDILGHMEKSMFKNYPEYRLRIIDVI
ncbi:MAG: single-stranded-DNA-specific exonuclease RecJ [Candidatus Taylorbacteria bacterium]|nr:single-stranded-DNA-specific exonuclease RecJ [Candidatus Taylorbacteria bacterium]